MTWCNIIITLALIYTISMIVVAHIRYHVYKVVSIHKRFIPAMVRAWYLPEKSEWMEDKKVKIYRGASGGLALVCMFTVIGLIATWCDCWPFLSRNRMIPWAAPLIYMYALQAVLILWEKSKRRLMHIASLTLTEEERVQVAVGIQGRKKKNGQV